MLNADHYTLLAGCPDKWDAEIRELFYFKNGDIKPMSLCAESLPNAQKRQHSYGRRSIEIVRAAGAEFTTAGIVNPPLQGVRGSYNHVVKVATSWAMEDPDNREVFIRTSSIPLAGANG